MTDRGVPSPRQPIRTAHARRIMGHEAIGQGGSKAPDPSPLRVAVTAARGSRELRLRAPFVARDLCARRHPVGELADMPRRRADAARSGGDAGHMPARGGPRAPAAGRRLARRQSSGRYVTGRGPNGGGRARLAGPTVVTCAAGRRRAGRQSRVSRRNAMPVGQRRGPRERDRGGSTAAQAIVGTALRHGGRARGGLHRLVGDPGQRRLGKGYTAGRSRPPREPFSRSPPPNWPANGDGGEDAACPPRNR
jgi:hypothetical protein